YFFSCSVSFFPELSHSVRMTLQYLLVERCMEHARFSSSSATSLDMLMPIVFVFFPIGFVAIVGSPVYLLKNLFLNECSK
ncbi:MAG: hypothetical protein ABFR47_02580, partial [Verrucomicrobiota bacterium]